MKQETIEAKHNRQSLENKEVTIVVEAVIALTVVMWELILSFVGALITLIACGLGFF